MPQNPIPLPPEAATALAQGNLIRAIKLLRASTGLGLLEAKRAVEAHAAQLRTGATTSGAALSSASMPGANVNPGPARFVFPEAAGSAIAHGDLITAIALLRSANPQLDLKTAKDAVDHFRREIPPARNASQPKTQAHYSARVPTVMAGDGDSHAWLLGVIAFALLALGWWLFGGA